MLHVVGALHINFIHRWAVTCNPGCIFLREAFPARRCLHMDYKARGSGGLTSSQQDDGLET